MNDTKNSADNQVWSIDIKKFFEIFNKIFDSIAVLVTLAIFITVIIQIVGRFVGHPASWTEEGTRFLFTWMIFLGVGIGFRRAESARVTVFLNWMPKVMHKIAKWIYTVSSIGFFLFMFFYGLQLVGQQVRMNEMGSALMIPMWIVGICIPISAVLGILGIIESLLFYPELVEGGE